MIIRVRLKGFTLMELLIAMALTGLIMLLGMVTISHFMQLFNTIKKNNECQTAIVQLYEVVKHDVSMSDKVFWDEKMNCIRGDQIVSYQFAKEYIVRETSDYTDTLKIVSDQPDVSFLEETELVNHISIHCYNNGLLMPLDIIKNYPLGITLEKEK